MTVETSSRDAVVAAGAAVVVVIAVVVVVVAIVVDNANSSTASEDEPLDEVADYAIHLLTASLVVLQQLLIIEMID